MRFSLSLGAFSLASFVAASPLVLRGGVINAALEGPHYSPGAYPFGVHPGYPGGSFPGGGFPGGPGGGFPGGPGGGFPGGPGNGGNGSNPGSPGNGGNGSNPGNGGNGSNPGNGGNGSNPGNGGNGSNPGNGGGGSNSGLNVCGVTPGQISALTPLLNKLGLSTTIDGVKQLVDKLLLSVGGLLESPGINGGGGLIDVVSNLVKGLLGQPLDLHNTIDAVTQILEKQVPCLLDTVLPKP